MVVVRTRWSPAAYSQVHEEESVHLFTLSNLSLRLIALRVYHDLLMMIAMADVR